MKNILLAILLFQVACTKDLQRTHQPEAIVKGFMIAGEPAIVTITREIEWNTFDSTHPLEGLTPVLVQNHTSYPLTYLGKGQYGNPAIALKEGDSCHLYFDHNGKEVSAHTYISHKPIGYASDTDTLRRTSVGAYPKYNKDIIQLNWFNIENDYYLTVIQQPIHAPWWTYLINSNFLPPFAYNTTPTRESSTWLRTADYFFGPTVYHLRLYHIQPEFALLFNDVNNNSLNIVNPPNNIKNGFGILTGISISDPLVLYVVN